MFNGNNLVRKSLTNSIDEVLTCSNITAEQLWESLDQMIERFEKDSINLPEDQEFMFSQHPLAELSNFLDFLRSLQNFSYKAVLDKHAGLEQYTSSGELRSLTTSREDVVKEELETRVSRFQTYPSEERNLVLVLWDLIDFSSQILSADFGLQDKVYNNATMDQYKIPRCPGTQAGVGCIDCSPRGGCKYTNCEILDELEPYLIGCVSSCSDTTTIRGCRSINERPLAEPKPTSKEQN